ncbi:MAG: hypothetical protein WC374_14035 [Phycisphaerae bacterium]|jgi:hypothetical protein
MAREGFFDSTEVETLESGLVVGDKAESSDFLAKSLYTVLGDGVTLDPTSSLLVAPKTGMTVTLKAGALWKDGYMLWEEEDRDITFSSDPGEQTFYISGRLDEPSGEFTNNEVYPYSDFVAATDICVAKLVITAAAVTITDAMITDYRYNETYCGTVDLYRTQLKALAAEAQALIDDLIGEAVPAHASTHAVGGADSAAATSEVTGFVSTAEQTSISDAHQTQARTNISAAKAVSGVIDAEESAVVVVEKTDNYTVTAAENGKDIQITSADAKILTIDTQANASYPTNFYFFVSRLGAGTVTIAGGGTTIRSAGSRLKIAEQYATVLVRKTASDEWLVTGALSA